MAEPEETPQTESPECCIITKKFFKCVWCNTEFKRRDGLRRHTYNCEEINNLITVVHCCLICLRYFTRSDNLKRHMKRVHGTVPMDLPTHERKHERLHARLRASETSHEVDPKGHCAFRALPTDISNKKACINVCNTDNASAAWCLTAFLEPSFRYCRRVSSYPHYSAMLNLKGVQFPCKLSDLHILEKNNGVSINVFGLEFNETTETHRVIGPLCYTQCIKQRHVNLLYLHDDYDHDDGNGHYVLIKNLSRLLSLQVTNRAARTYFCDNCLRNFRDEFKLKKHLKLGCTHQDRTYLDPIKPLNLIKYSKAHVK